MPSSLLVLTDFSPSADHALRYANNLAWALDAQLVLLHVRRDSLWIRRCSPVNCLFGAKRLLTRL